MQRKEPKRARHCLALFVALVLLLSASIAAAQGKLGQVNVTADAGAEIYVDGQAMGTAPLPLALAIPAGEHTIEARLGGRVAKVTIMVEVGAKSVAALSFAAAQGVPAAAATPAPAPAAAPAAPPEAAPAPPPTTEPAAESTSSDMSAELDTSGKREPFFKWMKRRKLAWVGGGLAVIGLGVGVTFAITAKSNYNSADDIADQIRNQKDKDGLDFAVCERPPTADYASACSKFTDAKDKGDNQRTISIVSFVVGGVALAGTVAYYFVDTKKKAPAAESRHKPHVALAPAASPSGLGLVVAGAF